MSGADKQARMQAGYIDLPDIADADHRNLYPPGSSVELDDGVLIDLNDVPDIIGGEPAKGSRRVGKTR